MLSWYKYAVKQMLWTLSRTLHFAVVHVNKVILNIYYHLNACHKEISIYRAIFDMTKSTYSEKNIIRGIS